MSESDDNKDTRRSPKYPNLLVGNEIGQGFTSENQPTGEAKSAGMKKKYALKTMLEMTVAKPMGRKQKEYYKEVAEYFDCGVNEVNTKMIMEFAMMQKAVVFKDPKAFQVVMDRAYGKTRQIPEDAPPPPTNEGADDQKSTFNLGPDIQFEV
jgi:hypothetical protein